MGFVLDVDAHISGVISTDSVRLCQVLTNLLSNAKKYTKSGSVELRVYSVTQLTHVPNRKLPGKPLLVPGTPPSMEMDNLHKKEERDSEKGDRRVKTGDEKPQDMDVDNANETSAEKIILHFSVRDSGYSNFLFFSYFFFLDIFFIIYF